MATAGTIYTNIISVVGGVGTSLQTNWNGNSPINSAGIAVDPVQGAVYISDSTANYYISKNYVPCGSLPTAPTNGAVGTCVSLMDQGSQCQFTCNTGYSLVGTSTLCAGTSLFPQTCGLGCSAVTPPINGGLGTCTSPLAAGGYCSVVCNTGYAPSLAFSSCNNGVLSAQSCIISNCSSLSSSLSPPINSNPGVNLFNSNWLSTSGTCSFTCNSGYTIQPASSTCTAGALSLVTQTCILNGYCSVIAPIFGTAGNCPSLLAASSSCQMTCNTGYTLSGASTSCSAVSVLTTQTCDTQTYHGVWGGFATNCIFTCN